MYGHKEGPSHHALSVVHDAQALQRDGGLGYVNQRHEDDRGARSEEKGLVDWAPLGHVDVDGAGDYDYYRGNESVNGI